MFNPGGANDGHLFSATTPAGAYLYSLLSVAVVAGFALTQPRRVGYLAAAGLAGLGAWILFEAAVFPHYTYDHEWYGRLIFAKLDPAPSEDDNRRVLAVLAYLNT